MADRRDDVLQLAILRQRVVDVVGHDHRQPQLTGQARRLRGQPVVVREQVVRELQDEPAAGGRVARAGGDP